ncbi:MAG: AlwI family type II restriction endonuclease [Oscillospiraceae bacterium]|nr:AlwI family type II restriction endonuclease [Oscillospiraceae bacterium]
MPFANIPYKSYCWCLGTTSYRTKNFNQNIERQLSLLSDFWALPDNANAEWNSNSTLQSAYYDFMKAAGFLTGDANNRPKDAREKTSGLKDIGLITEGRRLTEAGNALLSISKSGDFNPDNALKIPKDSFIYMKQLLKTSYDIGGNTVRPFIVLLYLLSKLHFLTFDEFTFLLPLCINKKITDEIMIEIKDIRAGGKEIETVMIDTLMGMDNYQAALDLLVKNRISEDLICTIGFNRKSRSFDKAYFPLYCALYNACINKGSSAIADAYKKTKNVNVGKFWRDYLFDTVSERAIQKSPAKHFKKTVLSEAKTETDFKIAFFKTMHLFKAKATMADYLDLNRRYIKTADVVLFEDNTVKLDIVPKHFFNDNIDALFTVAFEKSGQIYHNCSLEDIHPALKVNEKAIISGINTEFDTHVKTMEAAYSVASDERYKRLQVLIDTKFTDGNLINLLGLFESRSDDEISRLITDNAEIPTIFEYVLGIIWYKASGRQGRILDYMKLSLDADLLPKSHAIGGEADIVYEYGATEHYPEHCLLLEATLANASNQRSMEMEPVSRHLGQHLLRTGNLNSYCVFASNYLNINVVSDFRSRKTTEWFDTQDTSRYVDGMKIIPLQTSELKTIVQNRVPYSELYGVFEKAFRSTDRVPEWYEGSIVNKISNLEEVKV